MLATYDTAYGSRFRTGRRTMLLRRLLRDRRLGAGHRGAAHVARLRLVVAAHPVHGLAVVPHHEVMQRPFVDVDEFRLRGVLGEVAQQHAAPPARSCRGWRRHATTDTATCGRAPDGCAPAAAAPA